MIKIKVIKLRLKLINSKIEKINEAKTGKIKHPILPAIVLFGLIFVNFGPLKSFQIQDRLYQTRNI